MRCVSYLLSTYLLTYLLTYYARFRERPPPAASEAVLKHAREQRLLAVGYRTCGASARALMANTGVTCGSPLLGRLTRDDERALSASRELARDCMRQVSYALSGEMRHVVDA